VARTILNTHPAGEQDYDELPWFWSQKGPHKLQIAGLAPAGAEPVLRGDPKVDNFSVFCHRNGILVAVESIYRPADHMAARRLLATGRALAPEQPADQYFDLKSYSKDSRQALKVEQRSPTS
jgi:3-phenylpropionate/trans-cinnamate dioxygenase ferredoxin reductase subunit